MFSSYIDAGVMKSVATKICICLFDIISSTDRHLLRICISIFKRHIANLRILAVNIFF